MTASRYYSYSSTQWQLPVPGCWLELFAGLLSSTSDFSEPTFCDFLSLIIIGIMAIIIIGHSNGTANLIRFAEPGSTLLMKGMSSSKPIGKPQHRIIISMCFR